MKKYRGKRKVYAGRQCWQKGHDSVLLTWTVGRVPYIVGEYKLPQLYLVSRSFFFSFSPYTTYPALDLTIFSPRFLLFFPPRSCRIFSPSLRSRWLRCKSALRELPLGLVTETIFFSPSKIRGFSEQRRKIEGYRWIKGWKVVNARKHDM